MISKGAPHWAKKIDIDKVHATRRARAKDEDATRAGTILSQDEAARREFESWFPPQAMPAIGRPATKKR